MNWTSWVIPRSIRVQHGVSLLLLLCHTFPPFKTRHPKKREAKNIWKKCIKPHCQSDMLQNRLLNRSVWTWKLCFIAWFIWSYLWLHGWIPCTTGQPPHPSIFVILRQWHSCKKVIDLRIQLCFPFGQLIDNRATWLNLDELHSLKLTDLTYQEAIPKGN